MPTVGGIEGRETHQPVNTVFAFQVSEGKFAFKFDGGRFDTSRIAILHIKGIDFIVVAFAPAEVHAHEHLCPVLAFGTAGTGIDVDDGAEPVFLAAEHFFKFEFFYGQRGIVVLLLYIFLVSFAISKKAPHHHQVIMGIFGFGISPCPIFFLLYAFH